jgi:O-methyltransferase
MKKFETPQELVDDLIQNHITMVLPHEFSMVLNHQDEINKIKGEIVECGVWRGGFSIFLSYLFPKRKIWVCDSFQGFQPLSNAKYEFGGERHTSDYTMSHIGPIGISLEEVQSHFKTYGFGGDKRIQYLKGFVKDSLPNSEIGKIALLRIDVDAYSATLEVLEELYDKVQPGGYIIFDDSCLIETIEAMKTFFINRNLPLEVLDPINNEVKHLEYRYTHTDSGFDAGCYIIKQ